MKWKAFSFLLAGLVLITPSAYANQQQQDYTITVSGEATKMVVPDKVLLTLSVKAEDKKQVKAVELQGQKSQLLMAALRSLGVTEKEVSTSGYSYGAVYEYVSNKNVLRGYQAVQYLTVKTVREKAASIVDGVSDVANVGGVSFYVSNPNELREELVNSAIDDALHMAKRRADRLGVTLGSIVAYQESNSDSRPQMRMGRSPSARAESADSMPELPAGETEFRVIVSVTYKLVVN